MMRSALARQLHALARRPRASMAGSFTMRRAIYSGRDERVAGAARREADAAAPQRPAQTLARPVNDAAAATAESLAMHASPSGVPERLTREQSARAEARTLAATDTEAAQARVDDATFAAAAGALLDEAEAAVRGMAASNNAPRRPKAVSEAEAGGGGDDAFTVTRSPDGLVIDLGGVGTITLRVDPPLKAMLLETLTGTNSYQYNPTTSEWHEPRTGDDLRGLLTRDLLAQRKGSPAWK